MTVARIKELEEQVGRLERALDRRLDREHVRMAQSFTGCSEDRCPKAAQQAITGLILHAQALTASVQGAVGLLARVEEWMSDNGSEIGQAGHDLWIELGELIAKAKGEVQP